MITHPINNSHSMIMMPSSQERLDTIRVCPSQQQQQQQTIAIEYFQKKEPLSHLAHYQMKEQLKQPQVQQQQYEQIKRYNGQCQQQQHFQQSQSPQQRQFKQLDQENKSTYFQGGHGLNHRHAVSMSTVMNASSLSPHTPSPTRVVYTGNRRMNEHEIRGAQQFQQQYQQQQQHSDQKKNIQLLFTHRNSQEEMKQIQQQQQQSCFEGRSQFAACSGVPLQSSSPLVARRHQQLSTSIQYIPVNSSMNQQTPQQKQHLLNQQQQQIQQHQQQYYIHDSGNKAVSSSSPFGNGFSDANTNSSFLGQIHSLSPTTTRRQVMPVQSLNRSPQVQNQHSNVSSSVEKILQKKNTCIVPISFSASKQDSLSFHGNKKTQQISSSQEVSLDQLLNQQVDESRQVSSFRMGTSRNENQIKQGEKRQEQQQPQPQQQKSTFVPPLSLEKKVPQLTGVAAVAAARPAGAGGTELLFSRRSQSLACDPFVCLSERSKIFNGKRETIHLKNPIKKDAEDCIPPPLTERPATVHQLSQDSKALTERGIITRQRYEAAGKCSQLTKQQQRIGNDSLDRIDREEAAGSWRCSRKKHTQVAVQAAAIPPRESLEMELNTFRQLLHIHDGKQQQSQQSSQNEDAVAQKMTAYAKSADKENEQSAADRLEVIQTQIKQLKGQLLKKTTTKDRNISAAVPNAQCEVLTTRNRKIYKDNMNLLREQIAIEKINKQQQQLQQQEQQQEAPSKMVEQQHGLATRVKGSQMNTSQQQLFKEEMEGQPGQVLDGWFSDSESESGSEDTRISAFERQVACQDILLKQGIQNAYDLRDSLLLRVKNNLELADQEKLAGKSQSQAQRMQPIGEQAERDINKTTSSNNEKTKKKNNSSLNNTTKMKPVQQNQTDLSSTIARQNPIPCTYADTGACSANIMPNQINSLSDFDECFTEFSLSSCGNSEKYKHSQQQQQPSQNPQSFPVSSTEFDLFESQLIHLPMNSVCIMLTSYLSRLAAQQKHLQHGEQLIKSQLLLLSSEETHEEQLQQQSTLVQFLIKDISAKLNYIELLKSQLSSYLRSATGSKSSSKANNVDDTYHDGKHSMPKEDLIKHAVKYSGLISKAINRIRTAINKIKQAANLKDTTIAYAGNNNKQNYEASQRQQQQQQLQYQPTRDRNH